MCGLVGVMGDVNKTNASRFKKLLQIDTIRGPDSTGIMVVDLFGDESDLECSVIKEVGTPWDLEITRGPVNHLVVGGSFVMGHNRWATSGSVVAGNAHPFDAGALVGAHNGTLQNQSLLDDHECFEVDSENIFHHMAVNGTEDTIKKLDGSFALSWFDKRDLSMNFVRNKERPLFYVVTEDKKSLFWASEDWMLLSFGKEGDPMSSKTGDVKAFKELIWYKITLVEGGAISIDERIVEPIAPKDKLNHRQVGFLWGRGYGMDIPLWEEFEVVPEYVDGSFIKGVLGGGHDVILSMDGPFDQGDIGHAITNQMTLCVVGILVDTKDNEYKLISQCGILSIT